MNSMFLSATSRSRVDHDFIVSHDTAHVGGDLAPHVPVALPLVLGTILG